MADKSVQHNIKPDYIETGNMLIPLSDEEYYMAFRLSELDKISIQEEVGRVIRAEYNRRQYKELQNHGRN